MVATLPIEIWREIATHVPSDQLRELYSVNRAFLYVALAVKYRDVDLASRKQCLSNIRRLQHPIVSQHVRSLHFSSRAIADNNWKGLWTEIVVAMFRKYRKPKTTKQLLRFMRGLAGLTSLSLTECYMSVNHTDFPQLLRVVKAGCTTFGPTLRRLTLNLSPEVFRRALPLSMVFPCLEVLRMTLSCVFVKKNATQLLCEVFAPFINNHQATLHALLLDYDVPLRDKFDICPFLLKLGHFPRLSALDIRPLFISKDQFDNPGLKRILELHAEQLQELSLHIFCHFLVDNISAVKFVRHYMDSMPDEWYGQRFLHVKLKHLKVLEFGMEMFPDVPRTAGYLHRFEDSLTSLNLNSQLFSYNDVETVASAFTRRNILRNLTLSVRYLSPQLLALLATNLSALEDLYLRYNELGTEYPVPHRLSTYQFCRDIRRHSHPEWKLRIFTAWTINMMHSSEGVGVCEKALRAALPGLDSVRFEVLASQVTIHK